MTPVPVAVVLSVLAAAANGYPGVRCPANTACQLQTPCQTVTDCAGYIKPNASSCGCCPICVQYIERGEPCNRVQIPALAECGPELVCNDKTGTCVPPTASSPLVVEAMVMSKNVLAPCAVFGGHVTCATDGSYTPRQCDGRKCYCVTSDGRTLPYTQPVMSASVMECVCAREEHAISNFVNKESKMCDSFGNYRNM